MAGNQKLLYKKDKSIRYGATRLPAMRNEQTFAGSGVTAE